MRDVRDWPPETASRGTLPAHLRAADSAPIVRGYGPVEREQTSLGVFLLCVLAVIAVCSIGTCGDIEQPGGPDRIPAEVSR